MSKEDIVQCIHSYPGFFTAIELEEIICMIGRMKPKTIQFNWTPRYFDLPINNFRELKCSRYNVLWNNLFPYGSLESEPYIFQTKESTTFTCNRSILLKGFHCESTYRTRQRVTIEIIEIKSNDDKSAVFNRHMILTYLHERKYTLLNTYESIVKLDKPILLRPNYNYSIEFEFDWEPETRNLNTFSSFVRVDSDIDIKFHGMRGIVSTLILIRIDKIPSISKRVFVRLLKILKFFSVVLLIIVFIVCDLVAFQHTLLPNIQLQIRQFFEPIQPPPPTPSSSPSSLESFFDYAWTKWEEWNCEFEANDKEIIIEHLPQQFLPEFWTTLAFSLINFIGIIILFLLLWSNIKRFDQLHNWQWFKRIVHFLTPVLI